MLFCTWDYARFFALIFALYWAMPWRRARVGLLLGASLYFYACWNRWLALLIASTSLMDWGSTHAMKPAAPAEGPGRDLAGQAFRSPPPGGGGLG